MHVCCVRAAGLLLSQVTAEEFYRAVNVSKPSFIRVEADELTYDYHIMLRVEIEAELMDGSLEVAVSGHSVKTNIDRRCTVCL